LNNVADLGKVFHGVDASSGLIAVGISYVIGFAADSIASFLYYKVICKFLGLPQLFLSDKVTSSEQRILVREYSPENFQAVNNWKFLKTMSHNLSFASLILMLSLAIKSVQSANQKLEWLSIVLISLVMSVIFMLRAHVFDTWHYRDLAGVVKTLHLKERALQGASPDSP
jgi:hypothetical protein